MHSRRDFLTSSAVLGSALVLGSKNALAETSAPSLQGLVYSEAEQGQWKGKSKSHAAKIKIEGQKISLHTMHGMAEEHYIVRHTVVLKDGRVLGSKTFSPKDKAKSSFELPKGYKGRVVATSFCNLHDLWISEVEV